TVRLWDPVSGRQLHRLDVHRTYQVIPLLLVATLWYALVTTVLTAGQHYVERYYGRSERDR
ncbi:hypothetical protein ACWIGN_28775, partial [Streptomyces albidoflavus]